MNVYSTNIGCEKSATTTTTTFSSMAPVNPAIFASTNNSFLPSSGTTKLQPLHVYMSSSSGNENNCIDGDRDTVCSTRYSNDPYPWMALEFERSVINSAVLDEILVAADPRSFQSL